MEEVGRLQLIIKGKESDIERLTFQLSEKQKADNLYYSQQTLQESKGIFIIKEASENDERSRSASGNNVGPIVRGSGSGAQSDLQHRYELLESVNRKLTGESECLRKKCVEYEFK
jgi:hypothetical protein